MKTYRAGICGLGRIGWQFDREKLGKGQCLTHVSAYMNSARTELVGGCSPVKTERKEFESAFRVPVYTTLEELIEQSSPDIISICSPTEFHYQHVLYCLEKAISMIWLEKPPASSLSEFNNLLRIQAEHNGRSKVLVNYQRRYMKCYQRLKTLYQERTLGKCCSIHLTYSRGLKLNGSHILDMLFFIVGDSLNYTIKGLTSFDDTQNTFFVLSFESGLETLVSGLALPYHCIDISLICEKGRASVLHGGMTTWLETKIEHEFFPGFYRLKGREQKQSEHDAFSRCMEDALHDLIAAFEQDRLPQSCLVTARNTQLVIEEVTHG